MFGLASGGLGLGRVMLRARARVALAGTSTEQDAAGTARQ
jgi:hypothetical protein